MYDYTNSMEHYFVSGLFSDAAVSSYHVLVASNDTYDASEQWTRENAEWRGRNLIWDKIPEIFLEVLRNTAVAQLVEALRYKPEARGFDSRKCHSNSSLT